MEHPSRLFEGEITDLIKVEKKGSTILVTFNDPAHHNAISLKMWEGISYVIKKIQVNSEIRAMVFTGAGEKSFASGANIKQFDDHRTGRQEAEKYEIIAEKAQADIYNFPMPTIARINGYCLGGGLNVALCCDLRIASVESTFGIPAGRLGLGYRLTAMHNLVSVVGPAQALEIFFTAERFNADMALRRGLIHYAVPKSELDLKVQLLLANITSNAPLTLKAGKFMIRELQRKTYDIDLDQCQQQMMRCFMSLDYEEGKRSFAQKRQPVFIGK